MYALIQLTIVYTETQRVHEVKMVEKKTIVYSSLGGIGLILLTLFGSALFDGTHYYCAEKNISVQCDRFSSTGTRCYPQPLITAGYKDCSNGWALIVSDLSPQQIHINQEHVLQYSCNQKECVLIQ
jgi:hypothetical protein